MPTLLQLEDLDIRIVASMVVKSEYGQTKDEEPDEKTIIEELGLNSCPCLDAHEMLDIFQAAAAYRRRRRVRRY